MRDFTKQAHDGRWFAGLAVSAVVCMFAYSTVAGTDSLPAIGDVTNGRQLYRVHCAVCHGFDGSGKGPAARTLEIKPADHRSGSLMNARDTRMLLRAIQMGCKGTNCKGAMPGFGDSLSKLESLDLVAYLRSLHMQLSDFFPKVDQYLVKQYTIGKVGKERFQEGQIERLEDVLGKVNPKDLTKTVFTLFRADRRKDSPELVPQEPRRLAELKKGNKIGYVFFMIMKGPRGRKVPVGLGLDTGFEIVKLVTTLADPGLSEEYNRRLEEYVGMGKRGDEKAFDVGSGKVGNRFDRQVTRLYMLAVEAANAYELEERERSWADGTF